MPWRAAEQTHGEWVGIQNAHLALGSFTAPADAELIVAARNELVPLLDRLEAAEAMPEDVVIRRFAEAVGVVTPCSCSAQRARAEAAEAKVARAEALAEEWDEAKNLGTSQPNVVARAFASSLRAALAGDPR